MEPGGDRFDEICPDCAPESRFEWLNELIRRPSGQQRLRIQAAAGGFVSAEGVFDQPGDQSRDDRERVGVHVLRRLRGVQHELRRQNRDDLAAAERVQVRGGGNGRAAAAGDSKESAGSVGSVDRKVK